ncbi:transcriptional regulator, partial [Candidatus Bathyarchaeota archaeon]
KELWKVGIETSSMYIKPLHHIFDLGYRKEEFPNACYFAQHLLTLPTHPIMTERQLDKIIEIIRKNC